ncbi:hypothetical protein [Streptomyces sporangiiformans]|uniref:Protein kilB n=1 Tax=Streptomyces sporangiiformans TaxID=2315329 RepID=A0A505DLJ6_9ACTN|nr:hypothetical protein [Streptomyces sporangiiformans]TPQ21226.1 hypothetical protein FGD71_016380 [Streptomyces sporangiiformans]
MTQVLTSLVAVIGTLLGATLGYIFQRLNAARSDRQQAALAFSNAITDVIRSQQEWYHRKDEEREGAEHRAARFEGHRLRGVARQAMNGLTFHLPDPELLQQADGLLRMASDIHEATDTQDLATRTEAARQALSFFIQASAAKTR